MVLCRLGAGLGDPCEPLPAQLPCDSDSVCGGTCLDFPGREE